MESILSEHDGEGTDTPMDFDTLFDTKALRIMRILIPFFPVSYQPLLAVWVRFSQLQYALSLLKSGRFRAGLTGISAGLPSSAPTEQTITHLLRALKPCLSKSEYQELVRMQNLFSTYQRFQQLMPYLSALGGMSGDLSASDMMNMFSAMQDGGESTPVSDIMNAFSSMQGGENLSAADIAHSSSAAQGETSNPPAEQNSESVKQNKSAPAPNLTDGNTKAAETSDISDRSFGMQGSGTDMPDRGFDMPNSSSSMPDSSFDIPGSGSGMNLSQILDLISLFRTSSNETDAENNRTERQDESDHE